MDGTGVEARPAVEAWAGLEEMRDGLRAFLVRQCPDENDVEDVIQETFLRAARYRRGHRVTSLRPWAMRIALNVLADAKRRGVRTQAEPRSSEPDEVPARPEPTLADSAFRVGEVWLDGESARELVLRMLGRLRERDRALLDSYYGGELRTLAVSAECGIPQRVVKVRLYRARKRLLFLLRHRAAREAAWKLRA
jgi:RNA polymerase sigma factor (sigma-70 family)